MNTYDRHRLYLLRKQRKRKLRNRVAKLAAAVLALLVCWSVFADIGPQSVAPPSPAVVGGRMLRGVFTTVAATANDLYALSRPSAGPAARNDALRLFTMAHPDSVASAAIVAGDSVASQALLPPQGRTFDVLLIGVDSRLGRERGRADALQLITIDLDKGEVEILGIPRGTPSPLGYDSSGSNIIANVLAQRGRRELLRRVARLTGRDSLHYWMEVGFSDATGILELLGFEQPSVELQNLRRRKGYRYGDHTRSYNQARMVRTALLRFLPMLRDATGEVLLSQGLGFLRSNLEKSECQGLALLLIDAGIVDQPDKVRVRVRSPFDTHLQRDAEAVRPEPADTDGSGSLAERRIVQALNAARRGKAGQVISRLGTMFAQHAWLQVQDPERRLALRDTLAARLTSAWTTLGHADECERIARVIESDNALFQRRDAHAVAWRWPMDTLR